MNGADGMDGAPAFSAANIFVSSKWSGERG
jgi:hypothetical protein